jgi:hypothetical protein
MRYFLVSFFLCIFTISSFSQTGTLSASVNYQTGNTEVTSFTGKADLNYKVSDVIESNLFLQTNYGEQFGTVFDRMYKGTFELDVDPDDFYPLAFVSVENNLNRKIELRVNSGLGFGFYDNSIGVDSKTSVMVLWEHSDMVGIEPISTPMISARTRIKKNLEGGGKMRFTYLVQKYLQSPVYRMTSTFSISYPIYSSLSILITAEHRYETVQVQGVKPNDFSTLFGLEFGI